MENERTNVENGTTAQTDANTVLAEVLPVDVKKFIVWLFRRDEWHYDSTEDLWRQDGYRSRTTDELYLYYRTKGQYFR